MTAGNATAYLAVGLLFLLLLASLPASTMASQDEFGLTALAPADLPAPVGWGASAHSNDRFFVFGGERHGVFGTDDIIMFERLGGAPTILDTTLPAPLRAMSAVVDPGSGEIYLIGGRFSGAPWWSDEIVRFDPNDLGTEVLPVKLPSGRAWTAAVWHEGLIYIIGGSDAHGQLDEIVVFDPVKRTVNTASVQLPFARMGASAVNIGSQIWIFGGEDTRVGMTGQILRYTPATGEMYANWQAPLPSPRAYTTAVWDGTTAWVFGGATNDGATAEVVSLTWNPVNNGYIGIHFHEPLPSPRFGATAATAAGVSFGKQPIDGMHSAHTAPMHLGLPNVYHIGGIVIEGAPTERYLDEIIDYRPLGPRVPG